MASSSSAASFSLVAATSKGAVLSEIARLARGLPHGAQYMPTPTVCALACRLLGVSADTPDYAKRVNVLVRAHATSRSGMSLEEVCAALNDVCACALTSTDIEHLKGRIGERDIGVAMVHVAPEVSVRAVEMLVPLIMFL